MTQLNTLLNGGSALAAVVFAFITCINTAVWYKRTKNKTFISVMFLALACVFGLMGYTLSFLSVLFFGENIMYLDFYVRLCSYSTLPVGSIAIMNVGWDMFIPSKKYKKALLIAMISIFVFYYIVLYWDIYAVTEVSNTGGSELIDDWLVPMTIPYFVFLGGTTFTSGMLGISFFNFFRKTSGDIRKRAIILVVASVLLGTAILMDTVLLVGVIWKDILFYPRLQVIPGLLFVLIGLKPA